MFKRLVITSGLCSLFALSAAASAATQDFNKWTFDQGRTSKNTPVCSLLTAASSGATAKNMVIKQLAGHDSLSVTLYKDSWNIPQGKSIPIFIDFMDDQPLAIDAYGDGKIVDIALPPEATSVFLGLLADSKTFRIGFKSGSEQPWAASLKGIKPPLKKFVDCALKQENTQPF